MESDKNGPEYVEMELFMGLERRVDAVERDISAIKATLEQMDRRLSEFREDFNRRLGSLETDLRELRRELTQKMDSNFRWTIGVMAALWLSATIPMLLRFLGIV